MTYDQFLREACPGLELNWRKYRRRSARRRVEGRMAELGIEDFGSYLSQLRDDPEEALGLPDLMRVTVSRFLREKKAWDELASVALPSVLAGKPAGDTLRAWSAGCCGGEEPYSLALLWLGGLGEHYPDIRLDILATDIDDAALDRAGEGKYARGSLAEVPAAAIERWFRRHDGLWSVDDSVRRLVRFERHNLMAGPLPDGIDLVLCRYLAFTYYSGGRLLSAAERIHRTLNPGGLLMLGLRESLPMAARGLFVPVHGTGCIFRRV